MELGIQPVDPDKAESFMRNDCKNRDALTRDFMKSLGIKVRYHVVDGIQFATDGDSDAGKKVSVGPSFHIDAHNCLVYFYTIVYSILLDADDDSELMQRAVAAMRHCGWMGPNQRFRQIYVVFYAHKEMTIRAQELAAGMDFENDKILERMFRRLKDPERRDISRFLPHCIHEEVTHMHLSSRTHSMTGSPVPLKIAVVKEGITRQGYISTVVHFTGVLLTWVAAKRPPHGPGSGCTALDMFDVVLFFSYECNSQLTLMHCARTLMLQNDPSGSLAKHGPGSLFLLLESVLKHMMEESDDARQGGATPWIKTGELSRHGQSSQRVFSRAATIQHVLTFRNKIANKLFGHGHEPPVRWRPAPGRQYKTKFKAEKNDEHWAAMDSHHEKLYETIRDIHTFDHLAALNLLPSMACLGLLPVELGMTASLRGAGHKLGCVRLMNSDLGGCGTAGERFEDVAAKFGSNPSTRAYSKLTLENTGCLEWRKGVKVDVYEFHDDCLQVLVRLVGYRTKQPQVHLLIDGVWVNRDDVFLVGPIPKKRSSGVDGLGSARVTFLPGYEKWAVGYIAG